MTEEGGREDVLLYVAIALLVLCKHFIVGRRSPREEGGGRNVLPVQMGGKFQLRPYPLLDAGEERTCSLQSCGR